MDVKINETGKIEVLGLIDRSSGVNWIEGFIGNAGAFNDGQFGWDEEAEIRTCDQATYDWWAEYIAATEEADEMRAELTDEYGSDVIEPVVWAALEGVEFNDIPSYTIQALAEFKAAQEATQ